MVQQFFFWVSLWWTLRHWAQQPSGQGSRNRPPCWSYESYSLPATATCYSSPYQDALRSGCESRGSSLKRILRKKQKSCLDSFFEKGQIKDNNEGSVFVVFHCIHYVGQSSYVGFIHVDGEFIQLLLRYFTQMFMVRFNHLSSTEV